MENADRSKRVLVAGLYHETNTFVSATTGVEAFKSLYGDDLWCAMGDSSPLAGALETAVRLQWFTIPVIEMRATPSGLVDDEVLAIWWRAFEEAAATALKSGPVDAVFLVLHGAMVCQTCDDVEGEILARIRRIEGLKDAIIGGVTDLHANVTQRMARHSNTLITYRKNPHTDAKQTAVFAAELLDMLLSQGIHATTVWKQAPVILPPPATGTTDNPMVSLVETADRIAASEHQILAINVHAGFAFADIPDVGVSFTVITTGDPSECERHLQTLLNQTVALTAHLPSEEVPIHRAIEQVKVMDSGVVLLVEPADNIGGGAPGDAVSVLAALVEAGVKKAGVIINDPESVAQLDEVEPGEAVHLLIGGKSDPRFVQPLALMVTLVSKSDGRFTLEDPQSHLASMTGSEVKMGKCAVVRYDDITVLLTSLPTAPFDLAQWRSQGINPEHFHVIGVKAAVAHRRAYDPIATTSFVVQTAGPCATDLRTLPYRNVRRPVFPLS